MAITPQEATRKAQPDAQTLKMLEERIDMEIVKNVEKGMDHTYLDASIFPTIAARKAIMETYRHAGWSVTYHTDQRDGDAITISKATPRDDRPTVSFYDR